MEDYEDEISEVPEYSPKSEFSKAERVSEAVQQCVKKRSEEMRAGYFNTVIDKHGFPQRTWVKDSRKEYIGSVKALKCLLSPEIIRSGKDNDYINYKEKIETLKKREESIFKNYAYTEKKTKEKNGKIVCEETDKKRMPEIDEVVLVPTVKPNSPGQRANQIVYTEKFKAWNPKVNSYWNELVDIYDDIFATLNELIDNLNYFKSKASF